MNLANALQIGVDGKEFWTGRLVNGFQQDILGIKSLEGTKF